MNQGQALVRSLLIYQPIVGAPQATSLRKHSSQMQAGNVPLANANPGPLFGTTPRRNSRRRVGFAWIPRVNGENVHSREVAGIYDQLLSLPSWGAHRTRPLRSYFRLATTILLKVPLVVGTFSGFCPTPTHIPHLTRWNIGCLSSQRIRRPA